MIEAENIDQLWLEAHEWLMDVGTEQPSRNGASLEGLGFCGRLLDPTSNFMFNPERRLSPSYAAAELLWYLSGTDDTTMLQAYAPSYKNYTEDGVHAYGAYGKRIADETSFTNELLKISTEGKLPVIPKMFFPATGGVAAPLSQLQVAAATIAKDKSSRQAIIAMWRAGDLPHAWIKDKKDLPCTLTLQFLLREGKLNLIVNMRSNDMWMGFPYDVFCFTCLQQLIADSLNVEVGWYQHTAGSMHIYEKHFEKSARASQPRPFNSAAMTYSPLVVKPSEIFADMFKLEKHNRENQCFCKDIENFTRGTMPTQLVAMAATKFPRARQSAMKYIHSQTMVKYMEKLYADN